MVAPSSLARGPETLSSGYRTLSGRFLKGEERILFNSFNLVKFKNSNLVAKDSFPERYFLKLSNFDEVAENR